MTASVHTKILQLISRRATTALPFCSHTQASGKGSLNKEMSVRRSDRKGAVRSHASNRLPKSPVQLKALAPVWLAQQQQAKNLSLKHHTRLNGTPGLRNQSRSPERELGPKQMILQEMISRPKEYRRSPTASYQ